MKSKIEKYQNFETTLIFFLFWRFLSSVCGIFQYNPTSMYIDGRIMLFGDSSWGLFEKYLKEFQESRFISSFWSTLLDFSISVQKWGYMQTCNCFVWYSKSLFRCRGIFRKKNGTGLEITIIYSAHNIFTCEKETVQFGLSHSFCQYINSALYLTLQRSFWTESRAVRRLLFEALWYGQPIVRHNVCCVTLQSKERGRRIINMKSF